MDARAKITSRLYHATLSLSRWVGLLRYSNMRKSIHQEAIMSHAYCTLQLHLLEQYYEYFAVHLTVVRTVRIVRESEITLPVVYVRHSI